MAVDLLRIAITPEVEHPQEAAMVSAILDAGWDYVHLRHPGAGLRDIKRLIEAVPQKHHRKLRLHGHFELLNEFNLGGVHLNRRCRSLPAGYTGPFSRSCHSIDEIVRCTDEDYVTLSPIFDSVSKHGYRAAFSDMELMSVPTGRRVVALGGITPE
ncbi:MAG: thiamine phosphate synthase, partial [Muribaculaceae bacterium]|nr:thiamine phosphate synthase [Muribaculaceae bacterium]